MSDTPTAGGNSSTVEFDSAVLQQIRRHARTSMTAEICGVLLGELADGVTRVEGCIAGENAKEAGAHVTFTQETWQHIYKIKDAKFADASIVGWYHSHPGFGIFLSDYDLFIHKNFFAAPHQVAWVFDPHSDEEGCFGWVSGDIVPIKRIAILRQDTQTHRQVAEGGPDDRSIDTRLQPIKRARLRSFAFNNWPLYVLIAVTLLVVGTGVYLYITAPKVLPSHPPSSRETDRSPTKWKEDEKAIMSQRLSSPAVKQFFAQNSQVITITGFEVKDVQPVTIKGKNAPAPDDDNIEYVNYRIRYTWSSSREDEGWTETTYTYDEVIHGVIDIKCKTHCSKGIDRPENAKVACLITDLVSDCLFQEK